MKFSIETKTKILAVVNIFETSRPFGDFAAYAVLDDGAGVSYGISQFTHRSGSLLAVIENYLDTGGVIGRYLFIKFLPLLRKTDAASIAALAGDRSFEKALKAAAVSREMRSAQTATACRLYLAPAIAACEELGLSTPLSLAVVYDSVVHGSWIRIRDSIKLRTPGKGGSEKEWITAYVRKRHAWLTSSPRLAKTAYRTRFFLEQLTLGRWELQLPLRVRGVLLSDSILSRAGAAQDSAAEPATTSSGSSPSVTEAAVNEPLSEAPSRDSVTAPARQDTQPSNQHHSGVVATIEQSVIDAARKYDRVETIVKTAITRKDAAKSLWTTVAGTIWQTAWAVAGFAYGIPRPIWLAAALIVGLLAALYLYRQITLAKIRERAG